MSKKKPIEVEVTVKFVYRTTAECLNVESIMDELRCSGEAEILDIEVKK